MDFAFAPTQAAEISSQAKHAVVLYTPDWQDTVLQVLRARPEAYEAAWHFDPDRRAHVLTVTYEGGHRLAVALIDGVHNAVLAQVVRGSALVLSPYPLYGEAPQYFSPEESLVLPRLPSPL